MATYNDLISASLGKIGQLAGGQTATASELTLGLGELNRILGSWSAEIGPVFSYATDTVTWPAGQPSRTIGNAAQINTARPVTIIDVMFRTDGRDYVLAPLTFPEYQRLLDKSSLQSEPLAYSYNPTAPTGAVYLYPTPLANVTIIIHSKKPFSAVAGTDTVDLPPGWEAALVDNLAVELAAYFGASPSGYLMAAAYQKKALVVYRSISFDEMNHDSLAPGNYDDVDEINRWTNP
jgi:hypothetical protein